MQKTSLMRLKHLFPSTIEISISRWEQIISFLLIAFAVAFNLQYLRPEVTTRVAKLNDGVLHLLALEQTVTALEAGLDPTDSWLPSIAMGYPLSHYYQHLPYLPPAALFLLLGRSVALLEVFNWTGYLLLSFFPLSVYWSMRLFGFTRLQSALGGAVALLLATDGLYGLEFGSYVWRGYGMYTQLWGMVLLPLSLAFGYRYLRDGRGVVQALLLLAACLMSHLIFGYIAVLTLAVLAILPALGKRSCGPRSRSIWKRAARLALLLALVALATAYFLIPFFVDRPYMNRSIWEDVWKYDSYGHEWVLNGLSRGQLFDFDRFPALTILVGIGLLICIGRWRNERYRVPAAIFMLWLILYFGRPTWGILLDLLPMSRELHLHRLIAGVHLGGIFLAGIALAAPWDWAAGRGERRYLILPALLTALALLPLYRDRAHYLELNSEWIAESETAFARETQEVQAVVETLMQMPPGRVYAGLATAWGGEYRVGAVPVYAILNSAGLDMLGFLYHSLSLNADIQVHFDEANPEHYRLFNVRYVVAPTDRDFPEFVRPIGNFGRHRLYQVETSGYFDLVTTEMAFIGNTRDFYPAAFQWLLSEMPKAKVHPEIALGGAEPNARKTVALGNAGSITSISYSEPDPSLGRVTWQAVANNAYVGEVAVEQESMLLLKATYHPNWHAYVDGIETDTVMLMPSFIGVKLAPGSHHVRLEYQSRAERRGLLMLGIASLSFIAIAQRRRNGLLRLVPELPLEYARTTTARFSKKVASGWMFMSAKQDIAPHIPFVIGLVILTLIVGLPLFQFSIMGGHDALEYLPRSVEFYEGLKGGNLFPRWAPDLSAGYGQPFFNFNPPLFYYVSALFRALGFSFVASQSLSLLALLFMAGLGMYLLASTFFGRRGGLVSATAYLFAPYVLVALYVRHALADFAAFAFLPLAFWGLYRGMRDPKHRLGIIGALAVALLVLSSNPVALITLPALVLFVVWLAYSERGKDYGMRGSTLLRGLWYIFLGLALSAIFWLPALAERNFVNLDRLLEGYLNYSNHFVYLKQFFSSTWGYGLSLPGMADGMSFAIGPIHLLAVGAALFLIVRVHTVSRPSRILLAFFMVLFLLAAFFTSPISRFVWDRLPLLQVIEFPWRFLSLIALASAFICGFPLLLARTKRTANAIMGVLLLAITLLGFPHAKPERYLEVTDADFSPSAIASRGISVTTAREYEPVWVLESPETSATEPVSILEGQAQIQILDRRPNSLEFLVKIDEAARLQVNTFYFPGWRLFVDGSERAIGYSQPAGLIEFTLGPGLHDIKVVFTNTAVRKIGEVASIIALAILVVPLAKTAGFMKRGESKIDGPSS